MLRSLYSSCYTRVRHRIAYLESHVKHAVSLIEHEEGHLAERNDTAFYQVKETARGGNDEVASGGELEQLSTYVRAAVDDYGLNVGIVANLLGLDVDLADELSRGGEDDAAGQTPPVVQSLLHAGLMHPRTRIAPRTGRVGGAVVF